MSDRLRGTANPWEHRPGRHPSDPSTVIASNGSHICSSDAGFLAVAARLVFEAHQSNRTEHHDEGEQA